MIPVPMLLNLSNRYEELCVKYHNGECRGTPHKDKAEASKFWEAKADEVAAQIKAEVARHPGLSVDFDSGMYPILAFKGNIL